MNVIIRDLKTDDILDKVLPVLDEVEGDIKHNYTLKNLKLDTMITFPVLFIDGEVVAFSGLQDTGGEFQRVATRYFIRKPWRQHFIKENRIRYNWRYLVPWQLERATKQCMFTSHLYRSDKAFMLTCRHASEMLGRDVHYIGEYEINKVIQKVGMICDT